MNRLFTTTSLLVLAGVAIGASPAAAQVAPVPTREEIQRETLDDRLRQETPVVALRDEIERALRATLLTDEELAGGEEAWLALPDPLPEWELEQSDETAPAH